MKTNFLVSNCYKLWLATAKSYFAVDPYIIHVLEREGLKGKYKNIQVAPLRRTNRQELQVDHNYVDEKFRKYTVILTKRLDEIHNVKYGSQFWEKSLSLAFLRHVSMCYDLFQSCELNFDTKQHVCQVLDSSCYYTPSTFDEHRSFLQHTDFGQEQLFSIYCNLFYPKQFPPIKITYSKAAVKVSTKNLFSRFKTTGIYEKVFRRILIGIASLRQPHVGIFGTFFAPKYFNQLILKSMGKVQLIHLPTLNSISSTLRWDQRDVLARSERDFDRFDEFVFSSLRYLMPKSIVENFNQIHEGYKLFFSKYKSLKWAVCESWIGDESTSMALAILKQRGVKHLCNEHNYISYPFLGNSLKYQIHLTDEFVTLGWSEKSYPNLIRGASLFQWMEKDRCLNKEHEILFILGLPLANIPEINAAYGDSGGYGASAYFDMNKRFLEKLGGKTLKQLYVRSYPKSKMHNWRTWSQSYELAPYLSKVKKYDDFSISGRVLMQRSRLVVVNYLSTSYIESIIADIPTIFLWNKNMNFLLDKHIKVFDTLIESGICQTNPDEAADFINKIKDNPEKWWSSSKVQKSRALFLNANIGEPEVMIQHILKKTN
jgi:putative transferase (TIGR04331 family)